MPRALHECSPPPSKDAETGVCVFVSGGGGGGWLEAEIGSVYMEELSGCCVHLQE